MRLARLIGFILGLSLAGPVAAQTLVQPEIGIESTGACRQLKLRDRTASAMLALGCFGAGRYLATPTGIRTVEGLSAPPTSSAAGWTYQGQATSAADILGPQQPPGWFTHDGVRSVMDVPATASAQTTSAFGFYAVNRAPENRTGVTGMFGTVACVVANSSCWGQNPTVIDSAANGQVTSLQGIKLIGSEYDIQVTSPYTTVTGVAVIGSSVAQPAHADGFVAGYLSAQSPGLVRWSNGFVVSDGAALTGYLTGARQISGANVPGIQNLLNYRDASGVAQAVTYYASAAGSFVVGGTAAANGLSFTPGVAGQFPMIQSFGTDANAGLAFKAQGTGPIVTQSPLSANKGLYVSTSAQFAVPAKLAPFTVSALTSQYPCNATNLDSLAVVTDAQTPTYRGSLTGGGSTRTPVYCDGNAWTAH